MKQLTPEQKHSILTHYSSRREGETLDQILRLHDVAASRSSVENWAHRWNGTIASLKHKAGAGRPRSLTPREVQQHITAPIRRSNRAARQVTYTKVAQQMRDKTGKSVSDRTVQRIGKTQLGARRTRGKKRTSEESQ